MSIALVLAAVAAAAAPPSLEIRKTSDPVRVEVVATLPADSLTETVSDSRLLNFGLVDEKTGETGPTLFGEYRRNGRELVFTPRHRLTARCLYRAHLDVSGYDFFASYRVPAERRAEPAVVEAVYPTASQLPANLLKFYIHFSRPMREGPGIFDRIHLLDSDQKAIAEPWRLTELWSDSARRLTLYIHPGRIKTGVNLREEFGAVLKPGSKYTLVVPRDVLDAKGQPIGSAFAKEFSTTAEIHERIDLGQWRLTPPARDSLEPLVVRSSKPLDRHLLMRCLHVTNSANQRIAGEVEVTEDERCWTFKPDSPWQVGRYTLEVDPVLEDLAGNTPVRVFDTDLREATKKPARLSVEFLTR